MKERDRAKCTCAPCKQPTKKLRRLLSTVVNCFLRGAEIGTVHGILTEIADDYRHLEKHKSTPKKSEANSSGLKELPRSRRSLHFCCISQVLRTVRHELELGGHNAAQP